MLRTLLHATSWHSFSTNTVRQMLKSVFIIFALKLSYEHQKLLRKLKKDDVLVIKSIDRLGRNYDDILVQWRIITKEKQAAIVVLDMPLLDTRQNRDLTGTLIADIVLQLLSYVAQTEREFIRQRQREGIDAALARGVKFGREAIPIPPEFEACAIAWNDGQLSTREGAVKCGVCQNTFLKWVKAYYSQKSTVF